MENRRGLESCRWSDVCKKGMEVLQKIKQGRTKYKNGYVKRDGGFGENKTKENK